MTEKDAMESLLDRFWRESGMFDLAHPVIEGIQRRWYALPLLIVCGLLFVGLLFWLTWRFQKWHLSGIRRR